jgi:hypothetical protein
MGMWVHLREQLPAGWWFEVRYETLVANVATEAAAALEFLGLGWNDSVLAYRESLRHKTVHSPTYLDVAQPVHTRAIGRWRNYQRWLEPALAHLDPVICALGYS